MYQTIKLLTLQLIALVFVLNILTDVHAHNCKIDLSSDCNIETTHDFKNSLGKNSKMMLNADQDCDSSKKNESNKNHCCHCHHSHFSMILNSPQRINFISQTTHALTNYQAPYPFEIFLRLDKPPKK